VYLRQRCSEKVLSELLEVYPNSIGQAIADTIATQLVGDDHPWHVPQSLEEAAEELRGRRSVVPGLNEDA
jgi:hypothetical protein